MELFSRKNGCARSVFALSINGIHTTTPQAGAETASIRDCKDPRSSFTSWNGHRQRCQNHSKVVSARLLANGQLRRSRKLRKAQLDLPSQMPDANVGNCIDGVDSVGFVFYRCLMASVFRAPALSGFQPESCCPAHPAFFSVWHSKHAFGLSSWPNCFVISAFGISSIWW